MARPIRTPGAQTALRLSVFLRAAVTAIALATAALTLASCQTVPESAVPASGRLVGTQSPTLVPHTANVAYGVHPGQALDLYIPTGPTIGTIAFFHGGGWTGGSKANLAPLVMAELSNHYAVASIEYRFAPAVSANTELADGDQAIRYLKANAKSLGINASTLVAGGESAGGYMSLMYGVAPGANVNADLPPALAAISPAVSGVVDLFGPSDLTTEWQGAFIPPYLTQFLHCMPPTMPPAAVAGLNYPVCSSAYINSLSPLSLANAAKAAGRVLPPAYMAYGGVDGLVPAATQGQTIALAWNSPQGGDETWYDFSASANHIQDSALNKDAFDQFLQALATGTLASAKPRT